MADLYLFNSMTGKKERFVPIKENKVGMYVCGITVYDFCHIGHARVMVVFDVIARHLRALGFDLNYVRNITDIDDKIIKRANENNEGIDALTQRFTRFMHEDEKALGCQSPNQEPRAMGAITEMIQMIERLIEKKYAYVAGNGDVYYSVRSFESYGKLANRSLNDLRAGERIQKNEEKNDPLDFVLWKSAKPHEPSWESPWGAGRPGWHIECSAMSTTALGNHFDIHGGGMDLKFPHHECEIAQSEGACGHKTVNYWLHNGFVQIDNEKMSKSLSNFTTIRDVLNQYDGEIVRLFILTSHYRQPLNFSDIALDDAKKALQRLYFSLDTKTENNELNQDVINQFVDAMNNDFNTPQALAVLFEMANKINAGQTDLVPTLKYLGGRLGLLQQNASVFLKGKSNDCSLSETDIETLIAERINAKKEKNWARADEIRQQLREQGVILKDTITGSDWYYEN